MRTHILGAGSMGSLIAHELALAHPSKLPPQLLFKSSQRLDLFVSQGSHLTVVRQNESNISTAISTLPAAVTLTEPISSLVVATKSHHTVAALQPYVHLLSPESSVLFVQNGMGAVDRVREAFWPADESTASAQIAGPPRFFHAVSTHGAYKTNPNTVHHVGMGLLVIAPVDPPDAPVPPMVEDIVATPNLVALTASTSDFLLVQMEKLIINACINPLLAILDCFNGDLLHGRSVTSTWRRVIREAVLVFRAEHPQVFTTARANTMFDSERLLQRTIEICRATAKNSSSMREDVRSLRQTEIDSINGYVVGLGEKHKIGTSINKHLVRMVGDKLHIDRALELRAQKIGLY